MSQIQELEDRARDELHSALKMDSLEKQLITINGALHDLIVDLIARGDTNVLLTHPNSTIRETAKSYMRKE